VPIPNQKLFAPMDRVENAARRAKGIMITAGNATPPKENELLRKEITEIKNALAEFEETIQAGELPNTGGTLRMHGET
jgi:hypothetical protein